MQFDPENQVNKLCAQGMQLEGEGDREGYVPNVVYTCGCMLHENLLIMPYAVSDSATAFATVKLDELLNEMILK